MSGRANFAAEVFSEKQKVFQWMRRWIRENGTSQQTNVASFDLPDLIILLQCAGFTLHKFFCENELNYTNPATVIGDTLKIELTCSKSGMKAEMLKSVQSCNCPKSDDIKTEEFFSVTSCAPAIQGSFDTSLCPFLPTITHPKQNVVGDIFKELIAIIKNEIDETETNTHDVRTTIERMSLDPTKSLMQNLKDIKRVVDSFLGDTEPSTPPEQIKAAIEKVEDKSSSGEKNKIRVEKTSPNKKVVTSTKPKTSMSSTSGIKNRPIRSRVQETDAVKTKSLGVDNGNKGKAEKSTSGTQKNLNSLPGSAKLNRVVRSRIINKK